MAIVFLAALLIGLVCGLRSMTAPAVVAWGVRLGFLHLVGTWLNFLSHPAALVIFTFCAAGEIVADKFPNIPSRTQIGPLGFRILFGAICGAAIAYSAHQQHLSSGALLGAVGAIVGAYGGYGYRSALSGKVSSFAAALFEDLIAIGLGFIAVTRL
jgi:uncharacterized membrane protein